MLTFLPGRKKKSQKNIFFNIHFSFSHANQQIRTVSCTHLENSSNTCHLLNKTTPMTL